MSHPLDRIVRQSVKDADRLVIGEIPFIINSIESELGSPATDDFLKNAGQWIGVLDGALKLGTVLTAFSDDDCRIDIAAIDALVGVAKYFADSRPHLPDAIHRAITLPASISAQLYLIRAASANKTPHDREAYALYARMRRTMMVTGTKRSPEISQAKRELMLHTSLWLEKSEDNYYVALSPIIAYLADIVT